MGIMDKVRCCMHASIWHCRAESTIASSLVSTICALESPGKCVSNVNCAVLQIKDKVTGGQGQKDGTSARSVVDLSSCNIAAAKLNCVRECSRATF